MKKKLMATVLAGVMAVSMLATGCGGSKDIKDGKFTRNDAGMLCCNRYGCSGTQPFC